MHRPDLELLDQLADPARDDAPPPAYAELHCLSHFSFLRGASSARELVERAHLLGYTALAITDECSMAGIVRAHEAGREFGVKLIYGTELRLRDGPRVVLLARDLRGYQHICALITRGRRAAEKGEYTLTRADLAEHARAGVLALLTPDFRGCDARMTGDAGQGRDATRASAARRAKVTVKRVADTTARAGHDLLPEGLREDLLWLRELFGEHAWLAVELHRGARDAERLAALLALAEATNTRAVACGDVHMHVRRRKALQDTMVAIREGVTLAEAGFALFANGEHHLRAREELRKIYPEALLAESARIAELCHFGLDQLNYVYPRELVPAGISASEHLRALTERGLRWRWPAGVPEAVRAQIDKELALITELRYEHFFLTVHDVVAHARGRGILCQGRGSAANSAVCYALGITEVDPARHNLLFERFISRERNEPPDIDVDFEHERREEVIQYIYGKYGRARAALAATVISYQPRSAVRDVGKALGLAADQLEQLSSALGGWSDLDDLRARLRDYGFDPDSTVIQRLLRLAEELIDFPRHLSQHVGGFVISDQPLHELVPVENAAMEDRTIIQWDKDDLETLGLLKVDCLALGMLSCLRRCFELLRAHRGRDLTMATVPAEDNETYAMIQRADTVGVFQIESRAQMSMLPRLKPANFYDLVIEVAIVRPGPIQGGMVHPYLRRRQKLEPVIYEKPELKAVFGRTLGVPIFQEQVMQLVIVAADFLPGEADQLRRSMAAWKRRGDLRQYQERITAGMLRNGYSAEFAAQICEQIKGFGSYGFPESHAASFALLVYVSSWIKCHEPAVFACALINSQPMGFYQPAQIVQDLRRHGVDVRPVDVTMSDWDCTLEPDSRREHVLALRLGLRLVQGISADCAGRIVAARAERAFANVQDLVERATLTRFERARLAEGGVLQRLAGHRHRAHWAVAGAEPLPEVLEGSVIGEQRVALKPPSAHQDVMADYQFVGLSLTGHPLGLIRKLLRARRARSARELNAMADGERVRAAGVVTVRQSPQTATGVTFVTLEDETGSVNVVVWRDLAERQRRELVDATVLAIDGRLQVADGVRHLVAHRLYDWSALSRELDRQSRDFH